MATELDGLIGKEGTLAKFTEETRAALTAADLYSTTKATREAASESRIAADELRRILPAIRDTLEQLRELARPLEEQPESVVYGPRFACSTESRGNFGRRLLHRQRDGELVLH